MECRKGPFIKGDGAFLWAAEIDNFGGKGLEDWFFDRE